jgi:hypothetical protein
MEGLFSVGLFTFFCRSYGLPDLVAQNFLDSGSEFFCWHKYRQRKWCTIREIGEPIEKILFIWRSISVGVFLSAYQQKIDFLI